MTKAQLIAALENYHDDTPIIVATIAGGGSITQWHPGPGPFCVDSLAPFVATNGGAVQLMSLDFAASLQPERTL